MNWIIPANGKKYNHEEAFKKWGFIDWKQNVKYEIGDIVYIYCALPIKKILYKCKVIKINMSFSECKDDREFWKDQQDYESGKNSFFSRLELLVQTNSESLNLNNLLNNGLNGVPQGPVKISERLVSYIEKSFNEIGCSNKQRILYCRVGYMESYNGILNDTITNGGSYNKNNVGHEIYNFQNNEGVYYGYVQSKSNTINLKRIDSQINDDAEFIDDVLVVWVATKEKIGKCIVGWYESAKVFKKIQYIPQKIIDNRIKSDYSNYNEYQVYSNSVTLVLPDRRTEKIIGMGESNVWYGNEETNIQVLKYIENYNNNLKINIEEISNFSKELNGKEKEALVKIRENQNIFRKQLLKRFDSCCLCGMSNENLLIASHIKPWAQSNDTEKLSSFNGFLLCPNHDKVFDIGLISFDDNGNILISYKLKEIDRLLLNVRDDMKVNVNDDNIDFIRFHRNNIFLK